MINNFPRIAGLMARYFFDQCVSRKYFFHIQVLQRRKDNPSISSGDIRLYTKNVRDLDELSDCMGEVVDICEREKARAYINVAPKPFNAFNRALMSRLATWIQFFGHQDPAQLCTALYEELEPEVKVWVINIDSKETEYINSIIYSIHKAIKEERVKMNESFGLSLTEVKQHEWLYGKIPTPNGVHLLTTPFDLEMFKAKHPEIRVFKNHPTLLYYPDSLDNFNNQSDNEPNNLNN